MVKSNNPIPKGSEGFIPHLCCDPCADAIEFYKRAFGAEEMGRMLMPGSDKIMHAALLIDGLPVFLADDFPEMCGGKSQSPQALGGSPVTIHRYVKDCDAVVERAVKAGAVLKMPVADMFWGDRYGMFTDPFGHNWSIATRLRDLTPEEMLAGLQEMMAQEAGN